MSSRILVVEDDAHLCETFRRFLAKDGYLVDTAGDYQAAVRLLNEHDYDAIFTDINLTGKETGLDLLAAGQGRKLATPIIIITGFPSVSSAAEAVRLGGYDYLCKPVEKDVLLHLARAAVRHHQLRRETERVRGNLEAVFRSVADALITVDPGMLVTDLNPAATGFCRFRRGASGHPFLEPPAGTPAGACKSECRQRLTAAVQEAMTKGAPVELYKFECPAKNAVYTLKATPLLDGQGKNNGAVVTIRDETRLTTLERDLKRRRDFHRLLIGKSEAMQAVYGLIDSLADLKTTVLITGESGTGKELAAEALHYAGCRRDQALVKVNCSALAETVLESELFGHVRGAFTGATQDRAGRFAKADRGTLFLDEIGDLSPLLQQKLLRVLQEKEFERVGESTPIKVDVRIIAATNRDLKALVAAGAFREDLYYRLKVVELKLPSLKERR
jgi:two-component system response regulator HydG